MIVCDRCGKPVYKQASLTAKIKYLFKMVPNKMYDAQLDTCTDYDIKYDLCQECLDDVLKNLRKFIYQGKFKGELEGGSNG